jgi:hypothetical protein
MAHQNARLVLEPRGHIHGLPSINQDDPQHVAADRALQRGEFHCNGHASTPAPSLLPPLNFTYFRLYRI